MLLKGQAHLLPLRASFITSFLTCGRMPQHAPAAATRRYFSLLELTTVLGRALVGLTSSCHPPLSTRTPARQHTSYVSIRPHMLTYDEH